MQWWCAATGQAWTWAWRWYPGVWALVAAIGGVAWWLRPREATAAARRDRRLGAAGVVALWVALDWPLGPLGAGYLASVHALQFLLIAFVAAPLLVAGVRRGVAARAPRGSGAERVIGALTRPLPSVVAFNLLVVATHVPRVVDAWMPTQWGAFAIDLAWLVAGVLLWWPLLAEVPARPGFAAPLRMLYLFLGTLVHTAMAIVMIVRDLPMYAVYELAPPVVPWSALDDLKIAGGIMELAGAAIIFAVLSRMFFAWAKASG
jgi:putative membrane protein